ncbi:hypothetical protein CMUS01_13614 [Colletotrichum musicola]|uniref:Serine hydrolase domain-containing protein n=1 Tax=Colletotrichum musicola TaxID=2175873 RepID=A0A8H6JBW7_9PEZI|nr:hypothetical protein CMUS01_13614 [Colletotrichum musicola]
MGTPSKALLCLHGTGSSGSIFRLQLAKIRLALKDEFEFIFMDAPYPAPPGPGVLPVFASAAPFHGWFGGSGATVEGRLETINASVRAAVERWQARSSTKIVGLLAFSEGALVASLLLWQQQLGLLPWLPPMRFAALICCFLPDEASAYMAAHSGGGTTICVPTLHLHGRRDFCLARARKLAKEHCDPGAAVILEFEGGHQVPNRNEDCREAINHIKRLI